ncbi:MAG: helix-turn-helix domain-containing protein [Anaerovoracaceae bacterium]
MENYLSVREIAEKWGVSERRVNQYCSDKRIPGARKFGKSWAIPADAEKPKDPRYIQQQEKISDIKTAKTEM